MSLSGGKASTQAQADVVASATNFSKIRPTLFIALGGTGAKIALRVKRKILTQEWGDRRLVSLDAGHGEVGNGLDCDLYYASVQCDILA